MKRRGEMFTARNKTPTPKVSMNNREPIDQYRIIKTLSTFLAERKLQRDHKDVADLDDERPAKRPRTKTSHNASYASGTRRNFATGPGPYVG
jgi:hypothetical protein